MESEALAADLALKALGMGPLVELEQRLQGVASGFRGLKADVKTFAFIEANLLEAARWALEYLGQPASPRAVVNKETGSIEIFLPYKGATMHFCFYFKE